MKALVIEIMVLGRSVSKDTTNMSKVVEAMSK